MAPHMTNKIRELLSMPRAEKFSISVALNGITFHNQNICGYRATGSKSVTLTHQAILLKKKKVSYGKAKKTGKKSMAVHTGHAAGYTDRGEDNLVPPGKVKKSRTLNKAVIRSRISALINSQKNRKSLYFWTVTFPEKLPDTTCSCALNSFLTTLRKQYKDFEYLWVAERQKNSTLHYHIAIPNYVSVVRANSIMQNVLKFYRKFKPDKALLIQLSEYNGVHISKNSKTGKAVNFAQAKKGRSLESYLTKYVTKNESESFTSLWHCSRLFSALVTKIWIKAAEFNKLGLKWNLNIDKTFVAEHFVWLPWIESPPELFRYMLQEINHAICLHKLYSNCSIMVGMN
jgi:hypothetical protein